MSTRIFPAILAALLVLTPVGSVRAEEQPEEEAEVDLKAMLQQIDKLVQSKRAAATSGQVAFPFGHFLAVAPPPVVKSATPAKQEVRGPVGMPEFTISGKMKMGRQMKIFVGRGAYGVGDTVEGAKIVEIRDDQVIFDFGGTTYKKAIP